METLTPRPRYQVLDALWQRQDALGYLSDEAMEDLALDFGLPLEELEGVARFYHFFRREPGGRFTFYLTDSIAARHQGRSEVLAALLEATGARHNGVSADGMFGVYDTPCIGLSDQEPSALLNFSPLTRLDPGRIRHIVRQLRAGTPVAGLADPVTAPCFVAPELDTPWLSAPSDTDALLRRCAAHTPEDILDSVEAAGLRGMGGALFPTAKKWRFCLQHPGPRFLVCNADEGEPGTFKDRYLLQQHPRKVLTGMLLAGYALGASEGILYLRAEYRHLRAGLEEALSALREEGWLEAADPAPHPFRFRIRLQSGAGSYVCGEETALLESLEGKRGQPRPRDVFPVERGYLGHPTVVNNVETLALVAAIMEKGAKAFRALGTPDTPGPKLFCISGDVARPGIYEAPWGLPLRRLLERAGAEDPAYVQLSGPSGDALSAAQWDRRLDRTDLHTNGTIMVFNRQRDLGRILQHYNHFFREESCGACTPCRAGNLMLGRQLERLVDGRITAQDLQALREWGELMHHGSRCGLGRYAAQAILTAMQAFPDYFEQQLSSRSTFRLEESLGAYRQAIKAHHHGRTH